MQRLGGKRSIIWQRKSLHRTSIHRWDEGVGVTGAGHLWLLYAQKWACLEVALGSKANSFLEAL